ncbi:VOC family protein [Kitasatospora sp. NPDC002040]|uniref:VOC family protein n=1 Tax=Kitasatospora sp. NPDC002040 TaxID=3154661 RepID=UPI0033295F9C
MTAVKARLAQGTPCWVSLMTDDLEGAKEFYRALLGWEFEPGPSQLGAYVRATLNGAKVAGLGVTPPGTGYPVEWTTYFAVDRADDVAQRVRECGGTVAVGPLQAEHAGRLAIAADVSGAVFGLWQGEEHPGWELVDVPGAPAWAELLTPDRSAGVFYDAVFGGHPERTVRPGDLRDGPPRWRVHFTVSDPDLTADQTVRLGGRVLLAPHDTDRGRVARLTDPQGGRFSVVAPQPVGL